ncbi:penicillin-binding protein [Candidatus Saccharibacteria bacterium]|nr:penicillin-binding protein [Candidatus Saccharibacteria bacterium]
MKKKVYHPKQPYKTDRQRRARRSVHNSILPVWVARIPVVQRFRKLSRRRKVVLLGWTGASVLILIALFTTVFFANSLGSKEQIMNRNKTGVTLTDQSGKVFYEFNNPRSSTVVTLDQISTPTKQALIASEDKNFYDHGGFSIPGIANAAWQNIRPNGIDNGGSTLTQQLVKNALLSEERSPLRKYQELVLSIEIERQYTKDEILEMYLNSVYFGEGAFGIEDAAQTYFGVSAKDLTTAQASMLIGVLPAPSAYSPISGSPKKALIRQNYVLGRMVEEGFITQAQMDEAKSQQLSYAEQKADEESKAPHFALMVKDQLEEEYGEEKVARSGYVVKTSLNLDWQVIAEKAVQTQVTKLASSNVSNGASVVLDSRTGEVRALVGSADWNNPEFGKFNAATAKRQPGSSFKPIVYGTGIENRDFSAATIFSDVATDFGGYAPKNYDLKFHGDVTTRKALANSYNIPAIKALQQAGIPETVQTSQDLGITTIDDSNNAGLAMALGTEVVPLTEMTDAYATLANNGQFNTLTLYTSITDKNGKVIFTSKPTNKRAISNQTSHILSSILSDNVARATTFGSSLSLSGGRPGAVKTGTTEDYRDALTIGYTPSVTVGVWIGNNDNSPMSRVAGSSGAAPIWKNIVNQVTAGTAKEQFTPPKDITQRLICRSSGALADNEGEGTMTEYFRPGTLPATRCNEKKPDPTPVEVTPAPTTPEVPKPEEPTTGDGGTDETTPTVPITPTADNPRGRNNNQN